MAALSSSARLLGLLVEHPAGLTREELRELSGLSRTTLQTVVNRLRKEGAIRSEAGLSSGGRPADRWVIAPPHGHIAGIDLGRDHIRVSLASADGTELGTTERRFEIEKRGHRTLVKAIDMLDTLRGEHGDERVIAVAMGLPAPVHEGRAASAGYLQQWATEDLRDRLGAMLVDRWGGPAAAAISIENDANLGALGEGRIGVARGCTTYLYVKVSTGIGLGIVHGGQLVRGAHGAAGEWGHVESTVAAEKRVAETSAMRPPRHECLRCDRLNCLENLASFRAVVEQMEAVRPDRSPPPGAGPGQVLTPGLVIQDLARWDELHASTKGLYEEGFANAGRRLAYALVDLVRIFDPELVVVGGQFARAKPLVCELMRDVLDSARLPPAIAELAFVPVERIERSEIDGAITVAMETAARIGAEELRERLG